MSDDFTQGPAITPASALLTWFEGDGGSKRVRIPVVVKPSVLGLSKGYIAADASVAEADGLLLKLDDTALSVGLAERIRDDCPYDQPCAIWIEGTWGAVVSGPGGIGGPSFGGPGGGPGGALGSSGPTKHPFSVRDYVGKVDGSATNVLVKN